jgi:hypothetical protein
MKRDATQDVEPPSPEDLEAIEAVARDYVEGWFDGDEARMRRCLHPELVKRTLYHDPATGDWRLGRPADAEMMAGWTRAGDGRTTVAEERTFKIAIENVFRHVASASVLSSPYMDLLHIAKLGNRWLIVNVLWEVRQGETQP